jgi:sugar lactone lactonase YvrE
MRTNTTILQSTSVALATLVLLLTGCSGGLAPATHSPITTTAKPAIAGQVHGGQQPVSGATIQLYAVGITGLKSASTPLIAATVISDQNGNFSITGDWDCTSNTATYGVNPLLYIVASGGNPGISSGTNNAAITMTAAIGPCSGITASTFITLNELTTVAAAYALAPFMADVTHVGASGANAKGLLNAFNTANLLVNTATGFAPGSGLLSNATVPINELNSLADVLASCVNTSGVDGICSTLFAAATPSGGSVPADIVGVILNIASSPVSQVTNLFKTLPSTPPFQPTLASAPNDWTVALNFTGGGLNAPTSLALDASGNAWVANAGGNAVTELSPAGTQLTGSTGYSGSNNIFGAQGIAVDKAENVWLADTLLSSVVKLSLNNGAIQSSTSYTSGGISGPLGIAIDNQNNVWVANFACASVTELNSAGTPLGSSPLTANGTLQSPYGMAIDAAGNAWVTDNAASDVVEFNNNQSLLSGSGDIDGAILAPEGIALDANGRAWTAYQGTNSVSYFLSGPQTTWPVPYTGGGLSMPAAVAIDGQGTVWIANSQTLGSISKLNVSQSTPLSPATGLGSLNTPSGIAIDASGSIWTANTGDNSVSEFIGIAAPASLPLAANAGP